MLLLFRGRGGLNKNVLGGKISKNSLARGGGGGGCQLLTKEYFSACGSVIANTFEMLEIMPTLLNLDSLHERLASHRKAWNYNKSVYLCVYYTKSVYKEPKQKVSANSIVRAHRSKEIVLWEESSRVQLCKERNCWHSIEILTKSMNSDRKIMQLTRITSRLPSRIRKWNQLSQHSLTSVKVIPI